MLEKCMEIPNRLIGIGFGIQELLQLNLLAIISSMENNISLKFILDLLMIRVNQLLTLEKDKERLQ